MLNNFITGFMTGFNAISRVCGGRRFVGGGCSSAEQVVDDLLGTAADGFGHRAEISSCRM
jgi:hypothetical protein